MKLTVRGLQYTYSGGPSFQFPDFDLPAGGELLITGASGSGKSTLLHLLAGLLSPTNGSIKYGDSEISSLGGSALDRFRGQQLGIVFQQPHFVRALSAVENLAVARYSAGLAADQKYLIEIAGKLGIKEQLFKKTRFLSLGEQQRLSIARALATQPSVLLCDEPTSSLDDVNAAEVVNLLKKSASEAQASLIIVTHDARVKAHVTNNLILESVKVQRA